MASASHRTDSLYDSGASTCTGHAVTPQRCSVGGHAGQVCISVYNLVPLHSTLLHRGLSSEFDAALCHLDSRQMSCIVALHLLTTCTLTQSTKIGCNFWLVHYSVQPLTTVLRGGIDAGDRPL